MDKGPRDNQEDCILVGGEVYQEVRLEKSFEIQTGTPVFAVCDGMGGLADGEKISRFVCLGLEKMSVNFSDRTAPEKVLERLQEASESIFVSRCGTTVAGLAAYNGKAVAFNAGDSRVYRATPRGVEQLTHDHSYIQQALDDKIMTPEEARFHPMKSLVHFGVGPVFSRAWEIYRVNTNKVGLAPRDRYLLCSDGVVDVLSDEDMNNIFEDSDRPIGERLKQKLEQRGFRDNTSFIIITIREI